MPQSRRPKPSDFGALYHGTSAAGVDVIDQRIGGHRYTGMPNTRGFNHATTSFGEAQNYAYTAGSYDREELGRRVESVYEVTPQVTYGDDEGKRHRYRWEVDEHTGPNGWNDNRDTKVEALERARNGEEVSLKFESPLKAREIWSEDRARELTDSKLHSVPYHLPGAERPRRAEFLLGKDTGLPYPWNTSISFT